MTHYIVIMFLTSLFWACEKKGPVIEPPIMEKENIFEMEWATRMDNEKEIVGTDNTLHYKDWMLVGGDGDDPVKIMAFNKETGDKDWEIVFDELTGYEITYMFLQDNILIARNSFLVFAVNLDNKELMWNVNLKSLGMNLRRGVIASNGKFYLHATFNFSPSGGGIMHLYEFDIGTGQYGMVYSQSPDSLGTKTISPPVFWEDEENERNLLIFNQRPNAEKPPPEVRQDIVALDIKTKKIVWKSKITDGFASNGLHPPVIYEDLVITGGDWHMYAFSINTGEKVWETEISDDSPFSIFITTNHLIHDGRLYVNENGENVTCLNARTGALIWNNPKGGANCTDNMIYYEKEDYLVFTSWGYGSVMVLDALTGETIHREHRYDDSSYNNDVVYDPETDMFFTSTYKHAVGFRINKSK